MFTTHIDEEADEGETFYNVEIEYFGRDVSFIFSPEDGAIIVGVDVEKPKGCIDGQTTNGDFRLTWDEDHIELCCARYGSGGGGGLSVTIRNTPEVMDSLKKALRIWKSKFVGV
jgi:hypothetical protein